MGPLTLAELSLALALRVDEATELARRLVAGGHLVAGIDGRLRVAPPALAQLAELTRALDEELDAVAARLSHDELSIVGRFLEEVAVACERRALEAARRAIERP